ncbi:hypothetical protein SLE2022_047950 [Rubroshorea leprosula]
MALTDIRAMCGLGSGYRGLRKGLHRTTGRNCLKNKTSGMAYESYWKKHKNSSAFTAQEIRPTTSFMSWCCKIPIGDGFHEFL